MMSRIISVTGDASGGHNMLVPIGTPVSEVLSNVQDINNGSYRLIWGNCLTGIEIRNPENTPIVKTTSVISVVRKAEVPRTPCIHCGLCSECCPINLSPFFEKATTDGVVLFPSGFGITTGSPPSITETHEFVVPKSIPIIFDISLSSLKIYIFF